MVIILERLWIYTMNDVESLIYNELKGLREDFSKYMDSMNKRVTVLEEFKNKAIGMLLIVGGAIGYAWEYLKGKVM